MKPRNRHVTHESRANGPKVVETSARSPMLPMYSAVELAVRFPLLFHHARGDRTRGGCRACTRRRAWTWWPSVALTPSLQSAPRAARCSASQTHTRAFTTPASAVAPTASRCAPSTSRTTLTRSGGPMLTVYTAAASAERDRARAAIQLVASTPGMCVALDWVREMDEAGKHELELPWERQTDIAARCLAAARRCDVLWFLVPELPSRGAWVELGAAMATGFVHIIASGRHTTAFLAHERIDERYPDDLRAFERLKALR